MTATVDPTEGVYRRCQICGFKYRHEELRKNWKGQVVCKHDYEPRHPTELYQGRVPRRRDTNLGSGDGYGIIDASKSALKFTATCTVFAGDAFEAWRINTLAYTIKNGDWLEYDYYLESGPGTASMGGMRLTYTDTTALDGTTLDSDDGIRGWITSGVAGIVGQARANRMCAWYRRKIVFPSGDVGKTINSWELFCDGQQLGTYIAHYKNILIRDANGNLAATCWITGDPPVNTEALSSNYGGPNSVVATTTIM